MRRTSPKLPKRGVYVSESVIPDENGPVGPITLRTYTNALVYYPRPGEKPLMRVLMGNGAFKRNGTVKPFIKEFVQEAARDNQAVEFITYDESSEGRRYVAAERMRRFVRVLLHSSENGNALHLLAHSNSAPDALNAAAALHGDEAGANIRGVTLLTPIGYAPKSQPRGVADTFERMLREAARIPRTIAGLGSLGVLGTLTGSIASRFARSPVVAGQMTRQSFTADNISRLADVNKQGLFDINVLLAGDDEFYSADESRQALVGAGLQPTQIDTLQDATHLSTISDPRNGAAAYRFMAQQLALNLLV